MKCSKFDYLTFRVSIEVPSNMLVRFVSFRFQKLEKNDWLCQTNYDFVSMRSGCASISSIFFIKVLLILVSQRVDVLLVQMLGTESMQTSLKDQLKRQRGNGPTYLECGVAFYVLGGFFIDYTATFRESLELSYLDSSRVLSQFVALFILYWGKLGMVTQTTYYRFLPSTYMLNLVLQIFRNEMEIWLIKSIWK